MWFVRHCEALGQAPDAGLTGRGRAQAEALAQQLADAGIERIVSSPWERALASVRPLADRLGLEIETDERLAELVLSPVPLDDWRAHLRAAFADRSLALEGGESTGAAALRGRAAIGALGPRTLVVSHGALLAVALDLRWDDLTTPDVYVQGKSGAIERIAPISEQQLGEAFLQLFHRLHPGATGRAFLATFDEEGRTSYELLAAEVPVDAVRVLDVGCGDGVLLARIRARVPSAELYGLDMSPDDLALAATRVDARWLCERAQAVSLPDASVDVVVSHMALMLIPAVDEVFAEIARVLEPGGRLILVVSGGMGERGDAIHLFVNAWREIFESEGGGRISFGEGALKDAAGIQGALGPRFRDVEVRPLIVRGRGGVEEAWNHVGLMYNTEFLSAEGKRRLEAAFRERAPGWFQDDGRLPFGTPMQLVTATRR